MRVDLAQKEYLLAGRERAISDLEARCAAESATLYHKLEQDAAAPRGLMTNYSGARRLAASRDNSKPLSQKTMNRQPARECDWPERATFAANFHLQRNWPSAN